MKIHPITDDYFDFMAWQLAEALQSWRRDYPRDTLRQLWDRFNEYSLKCDILDRRMRPWIRRRLLKKLPSLRRSAKPFGALWRFLNGSNARTLLLARSR